LGLSETDFGVEHFFHARSCDDEFETLKPGDEVPSPLVWADLADHAPKALNAPRREEGRKAPQQGIAMIGGWRRRGRARVLREARDQQQWDDAARRTQSPAPECGAAERPAERRENRLVDRRDGSGRADVGRRGSDHIFEIANKGHCQMKIATRSETAATAVCRQCGQRFQRTRRAGRNTFRRHAGRPASYMRAKYCCEAHRKAASRERLSRDARRSKSTQGTDVTYTLSGVASPLQPIEISEEKTTEKTVVGNWHTVAGPVEYCAACRMAIMPRKPDGYITPYRGKDGLLYCDPVCRKRGPDHRDNEVFTEHEWRTIVSTDGVVCEVLGSPACQAGA
jgi:hypothetical protein